jgi:hypothetical protein
MTNAQSNADMAADTLREFTTPVRDLIANVREMEASFKQERKFIQQHRPDEQVGNFPLLDGIETMGIVDLELLKTSCWAASKIIQQRADKVQAEVDEAERIRAEQNMTEVEALRRAVYHLAARVTKLEGTQTGRLPTLPHVPRAEVPQFQGMPGGMGRHAVIGVPVGSGGARKIGAGAPVPETAFESGITRRQHPLDVIGSSGRRGQGA